MSRVLRDYLYHIRDETSFLLSFRTTITADALREDELLKRAVVRSIEIIGEAIKHIPHAVRHRYPDVDSGDFLRGNHRSEHWNSPSAHMKAGVRLRGIGRIAMRPHKNERTPNDRSTTGPAPRIYHPPRCDLPW